MISDSNWWIIPTPESFHQLDCLWSHSFMETKGAFLLSNEMKNGMIDSIPSEDVSSNVEEQSYRI